MDVEAEIREAVVRVLRMLKYGHEPDTLIEALLAGRPKTVKLEVWSRVAQLTWKPDPPLDRPENRAWLLD
jgi:hypothetical protein